MKRAGLLLALLGVGCSARVVLPAETEGGSPGETDVPPGSSTGTTEPNSDVSGPGDGPITTTPMPTTFGTTGFGSSGFESSGGPQPTCWFTTTLFETPEESRLFVVDQVGDGLDELWLSFFDGSGPGGSSEIFVFVDGVPFSAGFFPGFLTGLHDVDGDGILDGVGFAFGGGPPSLSFIPGAPAFIEGDPIPTELGFEDGFDAFVDMNGDGAVDLFRNVDAEGITELLIGGGDGQFSIAAAGMAPFSGDLFALPIEDSGTVALAGSSYFDPIEGCEGHPIAGVSQGFEDLIVHWVVGNIDGFPLNTPLEGWIVEGESSEVVLARACVGDGVAAALIEYDAEGVQTRLFPESQFVAAGDFAGTGLVDIAMGDGAGITYFPNSGVPSFEESFYEEADYGEPVPTRVFVVDIDQDGRDEIILGTRDGGSEIVYQRLDYDPC
jgi:hypothetical protein